MQALWCFRSFQVHATREDDRAQLGTAAYTRKPKTIGASNNSGVAVKKRGPGNRQQRFGAALRLTSIRVGPQSESQQGRAILPCQRAGSAETFGRAWPRLTCALVVLSGMAAAADVFVLTEGVLQRE